VCSSDLRELADFMEFVIAPLNNSIDAMTEEINGYKDQVTAMKIQFMRISNIVRDPSDLDAALDALIQEVMDRKGHLTFGDEGKKKINAGNATMTTISTVSGVLIAGDVAILLLLSLKRKKAAAAKPKGVTVEKVVVKADSAANAPNSVNTPVPNNSTSVPLDPVASPAEPAKTPSQATTPTPIAPAEPKSYTRPTPTKKKK
jgi:hypothetical protein